MTAERAPGEGAEWPVRVLATPRIRPVITAARTTARVLKGVNSRRRRKSRNTLVLPAVRGYRRVPSPVRGRVLRRLTSGRREPAGPAGPLPAYAIPAGCDPLRGEGEAYAERLQWAGVPVEQERFSGMFHGFLARSEALDEAREAMARLATALVGAASGRKNSGPDWG
ncbi:alpha/beta hydrolase fold domain-containing protein [Streptomyces sp. H27-D2]|uniref:alpha/beta hydrolase fold domain-containing protein n=1 Tax=Streptomyces sp. H27-D2 TaxID=3046304 RepID=UPI002DB96F44|nr:alpha/beta hydrolase fold domain-containing protein [Streptomyces sp. H27-D2]MEC4019084.1 alpha/beta hydrolase fold domain-containing protein [Streptomyces sp. H27-D2]